jgi:hypothetical protein
MLMHDESSAGTLRENHLADFGGESLGAKGLPA